MPPCVMHPVYTERSIRPGVVLGIGLGGFIDGIALHQIAHWHNMASAVLPPVTMDAMRENMRWDGVFHAVTWLVTLAGVYLLLADARSGARLPRVSQFTGQLLLGWGAFNLVEGLIDHHLLGLHHVRDLPQHVPLYDWIFLAVAGVGFIALGWWLSQPRHAARSASGSPRRTSPAPRAFVEPPAPRVASGRDARHPSPRPARDSESGRYFPAPRGD
jgi:uncharacterized membrane protein